MPWLHAARVDPVPFSPLIFASLLAVLVASCVMFWLLVRRWTSRRQWITLSEWAREAGFRFERLQDETTPAPFSDLPEPDRPRVRLKLSGRQILLVQLEPSQPMGAPAPPLPMPDPAAPPAMPAPQRARDSFNLLIRTLAASWSPTALRPTSGEASVQWAMDMFSLPPHPLMRTDRFVACGPDSAAARRLSRSAVRALLPPDIALLLHGDRLVLDFSTRPFDPLEFTRILALAEQLQAHLPQPE